MSADIIKCNQLIRREIVIPDCKESNPDDCNRTYFLYFPSILCKQQQNESNVVGDNHQLSTLPLIFAIHCFGCSADAMFSFAQHSDDHNAILVIPEGIQHSWNARYCCGYALSNNIDDIGFIHAIQSRLSEDHDFIKPEYTYATGWSNGGFLVMHASNLFRAIAPISGFIGELDKDLRGEKSSGKGLFIHQGRDDHFVRPTGCCHDPDMPKCCCGIAADACTGVADVAKNWAVEVNGCKDDENLFLETSYKNTEKGIECSTSASGKANTTICMYENTGHFNIPSFDKAFLMADEVIDFFSKDACGINNGKWHRNSKSCSCNLKYSGTFCLDEAKHHIGGRSSSTEPPSIRRVIATVSMIMLVLASYVMLQKLRRRGRRKSGGKYGKVEQDDIEINVM